MYTNGFYAGMFTGFFVGLGVGVVILFFYIFLRAIASENIEDIETVKRSIDYAEQIGGVEL